MSLYGFEVDLLGLQLRRSFIWRENRGRTFSLGYLTSGEHPWDQWLVCVLKRWEEAQPPATISHLPIPYVIYVEALDYPMNLGTLIFHIKII